MSGMSEGHYVTKRDGGIRYTYVIHWELMLREIIWRSMVWCSGQHAGKVEGSITGDAPTDIESILEGHVQKAIEEIRGIR